MVRQMKCKICRSIYNGDWFQEMCQSCTVAYNQGYKDAGGN